MKVLSGAGLCTRLAALAILTVCGGCASSPSGRNWGEGATIRPGWDRVFSAAKDAAQDPRVWVPAAGAAVLQIGDWDRKSSDWARDHTPVFGSEANAEKWSNDLRSATVVINFATLLATPSGDDAQEWTINKLKGGAVELAAIGATSLTTTGIKNLAGRERPNQADDESFPSGHASSAAVNARLAQFNLREIDLEPWVRTSATVGLDVLAYGTAWARVESGFHYPADTLAGIALGNFFASFFNRAFLDEDAAQRSAFSVSASNGGAVIQWRTTFR